MAKARKLEEQLAALSKLRDDPTSPATLSELRRAIKGKSNHVAGHAAEIAAEFYLDALVPDLVEAFARFMVNPVKTDPQCVAKTAIVQALYRLDAREPEIFINGISHVQMEPVWGGQVDTAAPMRGYCALALVNIDPLGCMIPLAGLLADPEADARMSAAKAIGVSHNEAGIPLLRFKILMGDPHPQVMCDCFGALLKLDPEASLGFVAHYLDDEQATIAEAAAIALGESHLAQAFGFLENAWEATFDRERRQSFLTGMAMLRQERAFIFLLELIENAAQVHADDAVQALDMYRYDDQIWQRVEQALRKRKDRDKHDG